MTISVPGVSHLDSPRTLQVSSYERLNRIGEGAYGTVYRAVDKQTNTLVALKKVRRPQKGTTIPFLAFSQVYTFKVNLFMMVGGVRGEMGFPSPVLLYPFTYGMLP